VADPKDQGEKSLEARVAGLEDKLAQLHVTEDELAAYRKVSSLMGSSGAAPAAGCTDCVTGCLTECLIRACILQQCIQQCTIVSQCTIIRQCTIVRQCTIIQQCFECGGGAPGGGPLGGGGFGMLGG